MHVQIFKLMNFFTLFMLCSGRIPLGEPRRRREDNIIKDLRIKVEDGNWLKQAGIRSNGGLL